MLLQDWGEKINHFCSIFKVDFLKNWIFGHNLRAISEQIVVLGLKLGGGVLGCRTWIK